MFAKTRRREEREVDRARRAREAQGWSQSELARRAAMTQPAVARFEAGGTVPTLPVLHRLASALGAGLVVDITVPDATETAAA